MTRRLFKLILSLILMGSTALNAADDPLVPTVRLQSQQTRDPDDLCFVKTSDTTGLIVVSDKEAEAVFLFDAAGKQIDLVAIPKPGNVDIREGFQFGKDRIPLIVVNQREPNPQLRALTIQFEDEESRRRPRLKLESKCVLLTPLPKLLRFIEAGQKRTFAK